MMHFRLLLSSILLIINAFCVFSQNGADDYFRAAQYTQAAKMFEKQLEKKKNQHIQSKLAYCYRMTNQLEKSFQLYSEILHSGKPKSENYYYFAEALMQKEQYDSAKIWFNRYLEVAPKDEFGAKKSLANLDEIKQIKPYFSDSQIINFSQNSDADDNSPTLFRNQIVFTSDRSLGFQMLKEKSGATGRDFLNIYSADIESDSAFAKASVFSGQLNQKNSNSGAASFTADGKFVYFEQNSTTINKSGAYNLQLFRAEADGNSWKNIQKLPFCTEEVNYMHPAISPDGAELFFVSSQTGGGADILYTRLSANSVWSAPESAGEAINTTASEGFPFMDRAGRLYFASKGHAGYGGFDLFVSEKNSSGEWQKPINMGKPINSPLDDISLVIFRNGVSGAFSSARDGGDDDIYFFKQKDSTYLFEKERVTELSPEKTIEKEQEKTTPTPKMSIDAATHIVAPELVIDLCSRYQYCPLSSLREMLHIMRDTLHLYDSIGIKKGFVLENIKFEGAELSQESSSQEQLSELLDLLQTFPIKVQFLIHSAAKGKEKDNLDLSKKQGTRLVKFLTEKGIVRERLKSKGIGEAQPLCNGKDCAPFGKKADEVNERVEMKVLGF
jgi:outer membrane protein OmpA-like peptidoglycan-associated protein